MKVCILGDGLTSLTLAKGLVNQGIYVDIFSNKKKKNQNKTQTLGITKTNIEFFKKKILNIDKLIWNINKIEIFSENLKNQKILNFQNKDQQLFSTLKNYKLNKYLISDLKKNKFLKFKKNNGETNLVKKNYKLIFNCDFNNLITKKFFYKKISKNYNSYAHTTIIKHKKLLDNKIAIQTFTKKGPIAFLPISETETSVVYSAKEEKILDIKSIINKFNNKYKILKIDKTLSFELKSINLRTYYYKNILAFGDLLHKLHPLAGQGFNMSIRDVQVILELIESKKKCGLELDNSIFLDFEKKTKHKNYLFSSGIDFVYEFFNLENKVNNNVLSKTVQILGKNKLVNNFFKNFADSGIVI
jgi:2-octaprenyl-6-methoxyphenol hydroxylase